MGFRRRLFRFGNEDQTSHRADAGTIPNPTAGMRSDFGFPAQLTFIASRSPHMDFAWREVVKTIHSRQ
jgi:hypothetical protein